MCLATFGHFGNLAKDILFVLEMLPPATMCDFGTLEPCHSVDVRGPGTHLLRSFFI